MKVTTLSLKGETQPLAKRSGPLAQDEDHLFYFHLLRPLLYKQLLLAYYDSLCLPESNPRTSSFPKILRREHFTCDLDAPKRQLSKSPPLPGATCMPCLRNRRDSQHFIQKSYSGVTGSETVWWRMCCRVSNSSESKPNALMYLQSNY